MLHPTIIRIMCLNFVQVVVNPSRRKLLMDYSTIASLELVHNTRRDSSKQSLYGIMNNTQTSAGNRLLRSTVCAPRGLPGNYLFNTRSRHEIIAVFLANPGSFFEVLEVLSDFRDLDRLLSQLVVVPKVITPRVSRISIGNIISLKQCLEAAPRLIDCLKTVVLTHSSELLTSMIDSLCNEKFQVILDDINRVINDRVQATRSAPQKRIQECFAVRAGIDGMLDVARRAYLDSMDSIHEIAQRMNKASSFPIKLSYTSKRGYHLSIPADIKDIPGEFIERVPNKTATLCTTRDLKSCNSRLRESLAAIYKLSTKTIQDLLDKVRTHATAMYAMMETIALLDMILRWEGDKVDLWQSTRLMFFISKLRTCSGYVPIRMSMYVRICRSVMADTDSVLTKPEVTEFGNLVIRGGRHPVMEKSLKDDLYVSNNTVREIFNVPVFRVVITGPNCAGKSTYMRAIAMITIIAHMGCYVPATEAFIPLLDRICSRFGTSDDMEENASTFEVEMTETAFILEVATPKSLVLIDELGRGTANDEGCAIAWSVSEELIQRRVFTCFATHYHRINKLSTLYPQCRCFHMDATSERVTACLRKVLGDHANCVVIKNQIRCLYTLKDGPFDVIERYGIVAARNCGMPAAIIGRAHTLFELLAERKKHNYGRSEENRPADPIHNNRRVLHHLLALRYAQLKPEGTCRSSSRWHVRILRVRIMQNFVGNCTIFESPKP
ncbi:TPA: LOW QUALITY PROTEIN: hypothetical protein N0F65_002802 [Lagenidium giganteum]|uniref:DNA mismatch repair proteins mutS family domain-containing protein n=1 Tax=Lagenidium giganteum TaxID=4803 RepID=A0AAV2ZD87_9STRA|nr:TPA: LOW QUALITY PROTEIN: hypothetical protein N0F65_002802 [Lagenidium giganteum]